MGLLQISGAAVGAPQQPQRQQQQRQASATCALGQPTRHVSDSGLLLSGPQCQRVRLGAAGAMRPGARPSATVCASSAAMGCGAPWQQLWEAAAGARSAPRPGGGHLEQRRQVQQSR